MITTRPAYFDHRPTMQQQREHKRQVRRLLVSLIPVILVAAYLFARRFA